jgi:hypothetical protein
MFPAVVQSHDEDLRQRIIAALAGWGALNDVSVDVQVVGGVARLIGKVPSHLAKKRCLDYCRHVAGVMRVEDAIHLQEPSRKHRRRAPASPQERHGRRRGGAQREVARDSKGNE